MTSCPSQQPSDEDQEALADLLASHILSAHLPVPDDPGRFRGLCTCGAEMFYHGGDYNAGWWHRGHLEQVILDAGFARNSHAGLEAVIERLWRLVRSEELGLRTYGVTAADVREVLSAVPQTAVADQVLSAQADALTNAKEGLMWVIHDVGLPADSRNLERRSIITTAITQHLDTRAALIREGLAGARQPLR